MNVAKNFKDQLRTAYNADANRRTNEKKRSQWKLDARQSFADIVKQEGKQTVLEIGSGAGLDAQYFQEAGFDVLATDLSPGMVAACKGLGLQAQVADVYELDKLGRGFDAIYSLNVLLHVPPADLPRVLTTISNCLGEGGLFFYGVYGGKDEEEVFTDRARMNMPRYFSFLTDEVLLKTVSSVFDIVSSEMIELKDDPIGLHFQSVLLRKK